MIRRPPRSTPLYSSAASDVYKRQAALLAAYMWASGELRMWDEWLAFGETMRWPAPPRIATPPVWRGFARRLTALGSDLMNRVARSFERVEGLEGADEYLDLLV